MCCLCCFASSRSDPRPDLEATFLDTGEHKEAVLEESESFKIVFPERGVSDQAIEIHSKMGRSLSQWTAEDCSAFYFQLRTAHRVFSDTNWRFHTRGDERCQIVPIPMKLAPKIAIERTLFRGVPISPEKQRQQASQMTPSYGAVDESQFEISLDVAKPFWKEREVVHTGYSITIVYPENPIDIDGRARHFIVATEAAGFGEISEAVFSNCLECVQRLVKSFSDGGDEVLIFVGGNLDGSIAPNPWHVQIIIYQPQTGWFSQSHMVTRAMHRQTFPSEDYEDFKKDIRSKF